MPNLTFKVQERVTEKRETRKFNVDTNVAKDYASLCERLEFIFPILQTTRYYLEWNGDYFFFFYFNVMQRRFLDVSYLLCLLITSK